MLRVVKLSISKVVLFSFVLRSGRSRNPVQTGTMHQRKKQQGCFGNRLDAFKSEHVF